MKYVVIGTDAGRNVYSVPDAVADNLRKYCMDFCTKWLRSSPHAKKYRIRGGLCYNEDDFIEYLNAWVFPDQKSTLVDELGWGAELPLLYAECPSFIF